MQLERLPNRLTDQVDRVRDRTAQAVGSDGGSVLRELTKLGRKLDATEEHLAERLDHLASTTADAEAQLDQLGNGKTTTWPRRLFWIMVGLGAGAVAAYLADPDRGDERRQELAGQAQTRMQSMSGDVSQRARTVKDEVVERTQDVKDQAVTSAKSVAAEAQHAAEDVKGEAQHAAEDVAEEAQRAAEGVKQQATDGGSAPGGTSRPSSSAPSTPPTTTPPPSPRP